MVDTAPSPRAICGPFLHSDTSAGALSYYDYQRALRSQKVALFIQEKSCMPGARKSSQMPTTRRVFHYKQDSVHDPSTLYTTSKEDDPKSACFLTPIQVKSSEVSVVKLELEHGEISKKPVLQAQSERMPCVFTHERLVKSATARGRHHSLPTHLPALQQRPKTATASSSTSEHTAKPETVHTKDLSTDKEEEENKADSKQSCVHRKAWTEGSIVEQDALSAAAERDALVKAFCWSTTTQRANDEVGWADRMGPTVIAPSSTLEHFPDPVSQKLTFRRYHSAPADWQEFGCEWDFVQTRIGSSFSNGANFCTPHRKNGHLPGYLGFIAGGSEADDPLCNFTPAHVLLTRTFKPRPTKISRRANIPGYAGHVHWSCMKPAHTGMPQPEPTTSARAHRSIPIDEEVSPFRRNGVFSKTITTISPHNSFNSREQ